MRMWPLQLLADGPNVLSPCEMEILLKSVVANGLPVSSYMHAFWEN
jgi:hypothetical protein